MPPTKKTAEPIKVVDETPPVGAAPAHSNELCTEHGLNALHPSTTTFVCEHGTWTFQPEDVPAVVPSDEDRRAALLESLTADELQALLDAKTASA